MNDFFSADITDYLLTHNEITICIYCSDPNFFYGQSRGYFTVNWYPRLRFEGMKKYLGSE